MARFTIYVRNEAQKVLLEEELQGQISDGMWENSKPYDHWKKPSDAAVIVRPESVGMNFRASRRYDFTSKFLLECVGDRMLVAAQSVAGVSYDLKAMKADLRDLKTIFQTVTA